MRVVAALAAAAATVLGAGPAGANPDLERAEKLLGELYFDEAAEAFGAALERGDSDPATVARIYLGLAEISASTGDRDQAIDRFKRGLALAPDTELPPGTSPKVGEPFAEAKRFFAEKKPLAARLDIDQSAAIRVFLILDSDPLDMVEAAAVTYELADGQDSRVELKVAGGKTPIPIPADARALSVALEDRYGNHLIEIERSPMPEGERAEVPLPDSERPGPRDTGGSFFASPLLWGGLAVAFAGTGVGFGLSSQAALDDLDELKERSSEVEFTDAQELEDKAEQRALIANVAFAAAGATAVVAAIVWLAGGDDDGGEEATSMAPVLGPDYVGAAAQFRF